MHLHRCHQVGTSRWGPPPCGRRLACNWSGSSGVSTGAEVKNLYYKFVEMNKEVNFCSPGGSSRANVLWNAEWGQRKRRHALRAEDRNSERGSTRLVEQAPAEPSSCGRLKRCGRLTGWEEAGSSTSVGSRNGAVCGVVSPCGRRPWFSSWVKWRAGATLCYVHFCLFHRVLSGDSGGSQGLP